MTIRKFNSKLLPLIMLSLIIGFSEAIQAQPPCPTTNPTNVTWTYNPAPVGGAYEAGQIVEFCITVNNYQVAPAQFMHGVELTFPSIFDLSSPISTSVPPNCGGSGGAWLYMPNGGTHGSGTVFGPGFYFDSPQAGPFDGNPFNNWGDAGTCSRTFCITLEVDPNPLGGDNDCGGPTNPLDGQSITPSAVILGDGESGSWGSPSVCLPPGIPTETITIDCCDAEPGTSPGTVAICNTGAFDLFTLLGAPVQNDGFWTEPGGTTTPDNVMLFNPLTSAPGDYVYTATGTDGCIKTSTITMEFTNLGNLASITYCGTTPTTLQAQLTAITGLAWPDPGYGGNWIDPLGTVIPGSGPLDPSTSPAGTYTYEFIDAGSCPTELTVIVNFAAGGGGGATGGTIQVCTLDPPFNPTDSLTGTPLPNGQWVYGSTTNPFLTFWNDQNPIINPSNYNNSPTPGGALTMVDGTLSYFAGNPPCTPQTVVLNVEVSAPANTGVFTQTTLCVTDAPVVLETLLDGTYDPGLNWSDLNDPGATFPGNLLDPSLYPVNTTLFLEYSGGLAGSACFSTNLLELIILPADADAGDPNTVDICESDGPTCMTDLLLGSPQPGGVWTDPFGTTLPNCFFLPGISPAGTYTYTVTSTCDTDSESLVINVISNADAGTDGTLDVCSNAVGTPLMNGLGGTPDAGGTWTLAGAPVANTIDGATVTDGAVYTYTVGTGNCEASATVTINLENNPFAGTATNPTEAYCDSDAAVDLFTLLGTPPSATTGTWTGPGGFTGNILDPSSDQSGTYTYTLTSPNCGSDSESINITIEAQPNAGTSASINVCPNNATPTNLLTALGGDAGGTWISVPAGGPTNGIFNPGDPPGNYTYEVTSLSGNCTEVAILTVNVVPIPDPGIDGSITVCAGGAPFGLLAQLGGTPAGGGLWTGPLGGFFGTAGVTFNPSIHTPGVYTYTITPGGGCAPVSSTVTVSVLPNPNPGPDVSVTLCENLGTIDLGSYLGAGANPGGLWNVGNPFDISGEGGNTLTFTYTVDNGTCNASSTLEVIVETLPNAGGNGAAVFCETAPCFNLSSELTGTFDSGGNWTDGSGASTTNNQCPGLLGAGDTFTYTVAGNACPDASAEVDVTVTPAIVANNVSVNCQANQLFYTVSFDISGGIPPYEVNGAPIAGSSFTSAPIATGSNYSFTISDNSPCADELVNGASPTCTCPASASFNSGNATICVGSASSLQFDFTGAGPFDLEIDNGTSVETYLGVATGVSVFPSATTTYTLVSVTDQNCTSPATGSVTINVENDPDAGADQVLDLCSTGATLNLNTILDGSADLGGTFTPSATIPFTPASSGTYTYTVNGTVCPDDAATYDLTIYEPLGTSGVTATCDASQTTYTVSFTVNGGDGNYLVNGVAIAGNSFTSSPIATGTGYNFVVSDGSPCSDAPAVSGASPNCSCPASVAFTGGNQTICLGTTAQLPLNLQGSGPWTVIYNDGTADSPPLIVNTGDQISVNPGATTTYTLVSVEDQNCIGSATGSITVNIETPPNAGPDQTIDLCGGPGNINLNTLLNGAADSGGNWTPSVVVPNTSASSGTYTYTVTGSNCPSNQATYDLAIFTPISTSGLTANCNAAQTDYTVSFNIAGGDGNYLINGVAFAGTSYTSAPIPTGTNYSFTISDGSPCGDQVVSGASPNCACPATASFSSINSTICQGDVASLAVNLQGSGPWTVTLNDGSADLPAFVLETGDLIDVNPASTTTYSLVAVEDQNCSGSAVGSVTVTVDSPNDAGPAVQSEFCGSSGNFNLGSLIPIGVATDGTFLDASGDPVPGGIIPNNTSGSGIYTYEVGTNACPTDEAIYEIEISNPLTITALNSPCNLTQTQYTVSFTINGGDGNYAVNGTPIAGNSFTSANIPTGTDYSFTVSDGSTCPEVDVVGVSPDCECQVEGELTGGTNICQGSCANLNLSLTGVGPFSVVYENSNDPTNPVVLNNVFNGQTIQVCPGSTATYTLLSVSDANCTGVVTGSPATVTVNSPLEVENILESCDATGSSYTLTFEVNDGTAPIVITPAGGTFNATAGIYTSAPIPSGSGYNFTINDAGACPPEMVMSPAFSCPCTTDAGTLQDASFDLCIGEQATVNPALGPVLDGNDAFQFVLHDGSEETLGEVLIRSNDGIFDYEIGLETGVTFYIVAIAGNSDGQGDVDLNDPCLSASPGVPVVFNPLPTASFGGDVQFCEGTETELNIAFTGAGPWTYSYSIDAGPELGPFDSDQSNVTLMVNATGTYAITMVSDSKCTGIGGSEANVSAYPQPTASISGESEVCENSGDGPLVTFTGNAPYTLVYELNGDSTVSITSNSDNYTIPANISGSYTLVSLTDGNCAGLAAGSADVSVLPAPTAVITGGGTICQGNDATFTVELSGTSPFNMNYTVDGVPQGTLNTDSNILTFTDSAPGTYQISVVNDQNCQGTGIGIGANLQLAPEPTGNVVVSSNLLCIGESLDVNFNLEGNGPFDLTYAINGVEAQINGVGSNYSIELLPEAPVIIELLEVSDGNIPACASEVNNTAFVQVSELPNAPVLQDVVTCSGAGPVSIGVSSAPGLTYSWSPEANLDDAGVSNPKAEIAHGGLSPRAFQYILTASNGTCAASDTMTLTVVPAPRAQFLSTPNPVPSENPTVYFVNRSIVNENTTFFWEFGNIATSTSENPEFTFPIGSAGEYMVQLTAIDQVLGCASSFTEMIEVKPELLVYVPSAFTADSDGLNDLWGPVMTNVNPEEYHLQVFDRNAGLVFETRDINEKWNGGFMNDSYYLKPGVYAWRLECRGLEDRDDIEMSGTVTLVR